jgi:hypothetical protein
MLDKILGSAGWLCYLDVASNLAGNAGYPGWSASYSAWLRCLCFLDMLAMLPGCTGYASWLSMLYMLVGLLARLDMLAGWLC